MSPQLRKRSFVLGATLALLVLATSASAQTRLRGDGLDSEVRFLSTDRAVLASEENRTDLPCSVTPLDPVLDFDLQFRAGYNVALPLSAFGGDPDSLRVLFRIQPLDGNSEPHYFVDRFNVPAMEPDLPGDVTIPGRYRLGPGRYRVDWLMRDRAERVCSAHWETETPSIERFEEVAATPMAFTVEPIRQDPFLDEPPVRRAARQSLLHVKLLVNFTPTDPTDIRLRPYDVQSIVSILRAISREPQIGTFSLVAFNMQEERVIFEQETATRIDFPALGAAVESIQGGVVDAAQLQDEESGNKFLTALLTEHLGPQEPIPDAIIFVGPKLVLEKKISGQLLADGNHVYSPLFYLIYNRTPQAYPWRDAISAVLKIYKGLEYTITLPKDFGLAMKDMMVRLTKD